MSERVYLKIATSSMNRSPVGNGESTLFGNKPFASDELNRIQTVLSRTASDTDHSMVESSSHISDKHAKVDSANNLFHFNGWSDRIMNLNVDYIDQELNMWNVGVTAIVRVVLQDGSFHENVGFAEAKRASKGEAMLEAKRCAVDCARQQCLRLFGSYFASAPKEKEVVKPSLASSSTSSKDSSQTADFTLHSQTRPVEKAKESGPKPDAPSPIVLKAYQGEVPVKEAQVPETKALETVTAEDMMGLEDIDLTNIAMEYSPKEMQPVRSVPAVPAVPQQPMQQSSMQPMQPPTLQPVQPVQPVQPMQSPTLTKPPMKPQQQFHSGMPLRNQAVLQGPQQGAINRGPNGLPLVRAPVSGAPSIGTVQNNAFSMKRNAPFMSFSSIRESPSSNVMPVSKR